MTEKVSDPSPALRTFIGEIAKLDATDHIRLARCVRTYVSKWFRSRRVAA